jgi:hypothetical protein
VPVLRGVLQAEGALVKVQAGCSAGLARQLRQAQRPVPPALDAHALLDTGAEVTCLDTVLIQQLGLPLAQLALADVPALGGLRAVNMLMARKEFLNGMASGEAQACLVARAHSNSSSAARFS